jgi:pro-apoptotic serine protease NMA111
MNGAGPTTRSKRKPGNFSLDDRPQKLRALNGKVSPGDNTPELESSRMLEDAEGEEAYYAFEGQPQADTAEWQATVERVIRNVVSIRFCQTCAFDTDAALTSEATGFVVDAERG